MLTEEQRELVQSNIKLAYAVAYKLKKRNQTIPLEDIFQSCSEGLCRAASRFNPSRGFKFSTYAYESMTRYFVCNIPDIYPLNAISLDESLSSAEEDDNTLLDFVDFSNEDTRNISCLITDIDHFISIQNNEKYKTVARMTFDGCKLKEIASVLNCSTQNVSVIQIKIRKMFKEWWT